MQSQWVIYFILNFFFTGAPDRRFPSETIALKDGISSVLNDVKFLLLPLEERERSLKIPY